MRICAQNVIQCLLPEFDPEEESIAELLRRCVSLEDLEWGLADTRLMALAPPYSLVELTDLAVSAGR